MAFDSLFVFQIIGAIAIALAAAKIAHWLWLYVGLPLRFSGARLAERYGPGSWALITGASDGLGKAFAEELARQSLSEILCLRHNMSPRSMYAKQDEQEEAGGATNHPERAD